MTMHATKREPRHVGYGILTWDGEERRSDRYGVVHLRDTDFNETVRGATWFDTETIESFRGKRVRMTCRVVRTRRSGHVGDMFHRIFPSVPKVCEVVDLGVGIFDVDHATWDTNPGFVLQPDDDRETLWMDPRKLYRLHDQTVALYLTETDEPCSPAPDLSATEGGALDNGDGSFQTKHRGGRAVRAIRPRIERIGDGMFSIGFGPNEEGRYDVDFEDE